MSKYQNKRKGLSMAKRTMSIHIPGWPLIVIDTPEERGAIYISRRKATREATKGGMITCDLS